MSGEATSTPKTRDGPVESLRMLKALQRSANKSSTRPACHHPATTPNAEWLARKGVKAMVDVTASR